MSPDRTTPTTGFVTLLLTMPPAMRAYFGIRGGHQSFFTTVRFINFILISIFTSSALSHVQIPAISKEADEFGLLRGDERLLRGIFPIRDTVHLGGINLPRSHVIPLHEAGSPPYL